MNREEGGIFLTFYLNAYIWSHARIKSVQGGWCSHSKTAQLNS